MGKSTKNMTSEEAQALNDYNCACQTVHERLTEVVGIGVEKCHCLLWCCLSVVLAVLLTWCCTCLYVYKKGSVLFSNDSIIELRESNIRLSEEIAELRLQAVRDLNELRKKDSGTGQ